MVGADTTTNPANFTQVETAQIKYRNGKFVLTVQVFNAVGGQATVRAVADDIFHFVLPAVNNAAARLLTIPPAQKLMGLEEHTGYFTSGSNPFPKLINPATGLKWVEIGYGLAMRGDQAVTCQWATDDLVYGSWTFLAAMHCPAGLVGESFPEAAGKREQWYLDPETIRRVYDKTFSAITYMTGISSGSTQVPSVIAEVFVDALGRYPVAKAKKVLGIGDATIRPTGAETVSTLLDTVNNKFVTLTQWRNSSNINVIGMAIGPLRDPTLTIVEPFPVDIRQRVEERINFRGISAVPAAISTYVGGTPVAVVGSSFAPSAAGLAGMQNKVGWGTTKDSEFGLFYSAGEIPANFDLLDVFFEDVSEDSASRGSRLLFGGSATKKNVGLGAQTDALYVSNTQGQTAGMLTGATGVTGPGIMNALKGNAPASSQSALYYGFGLDANRYIGVRGFGVRLYPKLNRAFFLGEGQNEIDEFVLPANWDWTQRLYPFLAAQTTATATYNSFTRLGAMVIGRKAA